MIRQAFPNIKIIHSGKRLMPGAARNLGIRESAGDYLAFIDSDCVADRSWLNSLVSCISALRCDVVVGSIRSASGFHPLGAVSYLMEFNEFMPGRSEGKSRFLLSGNMLCKREIFEKNGYFLEDRLCEDRILGEKIRAVGGEIYFTPKAVISHKDKKILSLLLKHQLHQGFDSARARKIIKMEGSMLVKMPLLTPMIPALRFCKLLYRLLRFHEYGYLVFAIFNAAMLLTAYGAWMCGFIGGILYKEPE
jgi:GT2 family glycosyltransferase